MAFFRGPARKLLWRKEEGCRLQWLLWMGVDPRQRTKHVTPLEIAVNEDFVEPTIKAIIRGSHTGKIGAGKIFVLDLQRCIRIRTGEEGQAAIG